MARLPRLYIPGLPQHVILEARAGNTVFRDDQDLLLLAPALRHVVREANLALHAYALLPDAIHLLGSPHDPSSLPNAIQALGRRYVSHYNRRHGRLGSLWDGRYRATVIDPEPHLLFVSRLIESLAGDGSALETGGRAGPRRSSYPHHVGLAIDPAITDHALYWALGNTPFERQRVYRGMAEQPLDASKVAAVLEGTRKGWVMGDEAFKERCARLANRRIEPLSRGRPKNAQISQS